VQLRLFAKKVESPSASNDQLLAMENSMSTLASAAARRAVVERAWRLAAHE
jgi:hypothetical protein